MRAVERMRTCRLDFAEHRYDCIAGIVGEHNATQLIITPPYIIPETAEYRLCCEPGGLSELLHRDDNGKILYPLPRTVTVNDNCTVTLIGYVGDEQVYKSRMVCLHFLPSADDEMSIDPQESGLAAEVTANTLARHTHQNKTVLDKLGEGGGNLTYDGKPISGGTSTNELVVNVKLTDTDSIYPQATADKTYEELSAAYAAGTKISVRATADEDEKTALLPLLSVDNSAFTFAVSLNPGTATVVMCTADGWSVDYLAVNAGDVMHGDTNLSLELNRLNNEVDANTANRHAHSNKAVLDSLSTADGKLKYNGEDVGLKGTDGITYTPSVSSDGTLSWTNNGGRENPPSVNIKGAKGDKGDKGDTGEKGDTGTPGTNGKTPVKGTDYWTAADQEAIVADVLAALPDGDEVSY